MKNRIVIAGFGETGLLVALNLNAKHPGKYDITGVSAKPCIVSGQELGNRLTSPETWKENYLVDFSRYKTLSGIRRLHAEILAIDVEQRVLEVREGEQQTAVPWDVLVIASGVTNGFWRNATFEPRQALESSIDERALQIKKAASIAVIGGGPSGASTASNIKEQYPEKDVSLFFSREHILPGYHPRAVANVEEQLRDQGVQLYAGRRAIPPEGFDYQAFTHEPIRWQGGQPPVTADLVVWATGQLEPNNAFIPPEMLNEDGFVLADPHLRVPGFTHIFTVGDIAASDPNRSSARNAGFLTVAHNIHASLNGKPLKTYRASRYRWGSILGLQNEGMRVFTPKGSSVRITPWWVERVLFPFFVRRLIYKGMARSR
ncbi:MAG: FAD-dependent oxidoreductase [Pseudomonadota bacterium]